MLKQNNLLSALVICMLLLTGNASFIFPDKFGPYMLSQQILTSFQHDSTGSSADEAAYAFSYIGEYHQALLFNDKNYAPRWMIKGFVKSNDSLFIKNSKPIDAKKYIIQRARSERIIVINEAHHNPLHRVFTASLLKELYDAGFRYFASETLNYRDSILNERHYPLVSSGYYTREPQYGNLIREALRLGYQVVPYEARTKAEFASGKSREIAQARHLEAILKKDPKGKILVHCGYDHVVEVPLTNSWQKAMAGWLKEFTDIDPLTIDQQQWTELSNVNKEHPLYQPMSVQKASVYQNTDGSIYPGIELGRTDIQVAHPRTQYQHSRPKWLLRDGTWKPYFLSRTLDTPNPPFLALAYQISEDILNGNPMQQAVPIDVIELRDMGEKKALILPAGRYQIVLRDMIGNEKIFNVIHK